MKTISLTAPVCTPETTSAPIAPAGPATIKQPHGKQQQGHSMLGNLLLLTAIAALGLLAFSVYQASFEAGLERVYALLATGTSGLLALHHSLLH